MKNKANYFFVPATALMTVALTYFALDQKPRESIARMTFQIASQTGPMISLDEERDLILSDTLLAQVVKDIDLQTTKPSARFRSFDLGPNFKSQENSVVEGLKSLEKNLTVYAYRDKSWLSIEYKGPDANAAVKIVETIFEKYSDWRKASPSFNDDMIKADRNLSEKRDIFLKSQKQFLDFVESQKAQQLSGDQHGSVDVKRALLEAKISSLKERYGPKHPLMIEAMTELEALNKVPVVDRGRDIKAKLNALRVQMEKDFQALDVAIRETVLVEQKSKEGSGVKILPLGDVEIHESNRRLSFKLTLAGLIGLFCSLLYIALRQPASHKIHNARQLSRYSDHVVVADIDGLANVLRDDVPVPTGALADQLKTLRQELKLRGMYKLVNVTSTLNNEGAREVALGLGRLAARAGEKVLLLEANLRDPTLNAAMQLRAPRNLVDYLSGQSSIEDIIIRSDPSGLHTVFGTAIPKTALDLLSSEKMKILILSLREVYDLVLVVSPALDKGPDARVIGNLADQTLFVVEKGSTLRKRLQAGLQAFHDSVIDTISHVLVQK